MIFPINAERHLIKCSSLNKIPKNRTRRKLLKYNEDYFPETKSKFCLNDKALKAF